MEQTTIMLHDFEDCLEMYSKSNLVYIEEKMIEFGKLEKQLKQLHLRVKKLKNGSATPYDNEILAVTKKLKTASGVDFETLLRRKNVLECKAEQYFVKYYPDDIANHSISLRELTKKQN